MNIRQALAVSSLAVSSKPAEHAFKEPTARALRIAERVYAMAEEQGAALQGTPLAWRREWLQSQTFYLVDLPLHFAACPLKARNADKIQGCMRAAADSQEPIVVDVNKNRLGMSNGGYFPPVIVVDGKHRHAAYRLQGRERIKAWVGELAAEALGLTIHADHQFGSREIEQKIRQELEKQYPVDPEKPYSDRPYLEETFPLENYFVFSKGGKKYRQHFTTDLKSRSVKLKPNPTEVTQKYIDLKAAADKIQQRFVRIQANAIEKAMQIFGAAGGAGMGGPSGVSTSLSQGSGPSLAMKPRPTTGGGTAMPSMKSKGMKKKKARLRTSGYLGYRDASRTQSQKTRGGSKSEMSPQLKGSGYFGYQDASDVERQRMKAPKGSNFNDPKTRNRKYNSLDDVEGLKGEAEILADAAKVGKIWNECKAAMKAGWKPKMEAVAPPGMEDTVKGLKKHFGEGSSSPFRLAWWMYDKRNKGKK